MTAPYTLLIADDDPHIREVLRFALQQAGFAVIEAADGQQALALANSHQPDAAILDIMMPELDGTEVCRRLRQQTATQKPLPILFLTSRDDEVDRIVGLELGADDYITKPFSPRELVARVKAVFRRIEETRQSVSQPGQSTLQHGLLSLDLDAHSARWGEQLLDFTATEFGMLKTLLARPGKVFSRDELMDGAYSVHRVVSDRTIDSHMRRLRAKFSEVGGDPIETVHGVGYRVRSSA